MEEVIFRILKEGLSEGLVYVIFVFISIWIYKEIRNGYQKKISDNLIRIEKCLIIYSKVLLHISKFKNNEISHSVLSECITDLLPTCSKRVYYKYFNWEESKSETDLEGLIKCIKNEMDFFKSEQESEHINWVDDELFEGPLGNSMKRSSVKTIIFPMLITLFILTLAILIILISIVISGRNTLDQILMGLSLAGLVFAVMIIARILEFIMYKKILSMKKFLFCTFIFAGIAVLTLKFIPLYGGIILILSTMIYWYILSKYKLVKIH